MRTLVLTLLCGFGAIHGSVVIWERWSASCTGEILSVTPNGACFTGDGDGCRRSILFRDGRTVDASSIPFEEPWKLREGDTVHKNRGEFFITINGLRRPWPREEGGFYFLIMAAGSLGLVAMLADRLADRLASRRRAIPPTRGISDASAHLGVVAGGSAYSTRIGLRASSWRANLKFAVAIPPIFIFASLFVDSGGGTVAVIAAGVMGCVMVAFMTFFLRRVSPARVGYFGRQFESRVMRWHLERACRRGRCTRFEGVVSAARETHGEHPVVWQALQLEFAGNRYVDVVETVPVELGTELVLKDDKGHVLLIAPDNALMFGAIAAYRAPTDAEQRAARELPSLRVLAIMKDLVGIAGAALCLGDRVVAYGREGARRSSAGEQLWRENATVACIEPAPEMDAVFFARA